MVKLLFNKKKYQFYPLL